MGCEPGGHQQEGQIWAHLRMKSLPSWETPSQRSPSSLGAAVMMLLKHSRVLGPQKGGSPLSMMYLHTTAQPHWPPYKHPAQRRDGTQAVTMRMADGVIDISR